MIISDNERIKWMRGLKKELECVKLEKICTWGMRKLRKVGNDWASFANAH